MDGKPSIPIAELSPKVRPTMMGSRVVHLVGSEEIPFRALCGKRPRKSITQPKEGEVTCFDCVMRYQRGEMTSL